MSQTFNDLFTLIWYGVCGTGLLIVVLAVVSKSPTKRSTSSRLQGKRPSSARTGESAQ